VKLVWTPRALEDRRTIFDYIAADDPPAAVLVDERIAEAARRLIDFPQSGRPGRVDGTRELVIARTSYVAPYLVDGNVVRILRVIHGARIWPVEIPDEQ
jgi:addiction module RelE/StbE family toxin